MLGVKVFLSALLSFSLAFANEGGGHGGGEGGGEGEKKEEKKEAKSAEDSFAVVQARVQGLEAKVRSGQEEIEKLIQEKQHTTDGKRLNEIIREMLKIHKELEKNLAEYDQQRSLLKYRYPEKTNSEKREYEKIELKSIEEMESQVSVSSSLKKTMQKVRKQYKLATPEEKHKSSPHGEAVPAKSPSLTEPVILKK